MSVFFHSTQCLCSACMWWHVPEACSFYCRVWSVSRCAGTWQFAHPFLMLGIWVAASFSLRSWLFVFVGQMPPPRYVPRSGIAGPNGECALNFSAYCQAVLQKQFRHCPSPQQRMRVPWLRVLTTLVTANLPVFNPSREYGAASHCGCSVHLPMTDGLIVYSASPYWPRVYLFL